MLCGGQGNKYSQTMKKNLLFVIGAIVTMCMASCSTGRYLNNSQNVNLTQTQVVLSQANFQVVKQVKVTFVYKNLHSMRFNASQLQASAYAALVEEAKLTGAQALINVTMEQVQRQEHNFVSCVFRLSPKYEQAITVSGTVIEFLPAGIAPTHSAVVESYRYGEPLAESDSTVVTPTQSTDNTAITQDTIPTNSVATQDTTQTKMVQPIKVVYPLPTVDANSHKPSYTLMKERYNTHYPWFWEAIMEVCNYYSYYDSTQEIDKVTQFLLSDNEEQINALMQQVSVKRNLSRAQMAGLFLYYAKQQD